MAHTHSTYTVFPGQSPVPGVQQLRSSVRQDNPSPPRARSASPQPAPRKQVTRAQHRNSTSSRSHNRPNAKQKTVKVTVWVKPGVKAELQRIAEQEGLSASATGAAFLEKALQQDIHTQHGALLETIIAKAIGKQMRSYSTRLAVLLVRSVFASEQTRSIATNILGRQPGVTQPVLERILNGSSNAAKRNIIRVTPQLATIIAEVEKWLAEEIQSDA
jgi:hypothetical protein